MEAENVQKTLAKQSLGNQKIQHWMAGFSQMRKQIQDPPTRVFL